MLIHPNHSANYRNWAYCCAAINRLYKEIDLCENGPIPAGAYFYIKVHGKEAFLRRRKSKIPSLSKKISHYARLRDKLEAGLDDPKQHLLQVEDMLNMIGNVIEITPRHSRKKVYCTLNKCSPDGSRINGFDTYDLLAFGYGK